MKLLWAPWRDAYIRRSVRAKGPGRCFLCACAASKRDREALVVARAKTCFAVLNRYPYTGGHLLIAPRAHKADPARLTREEREDFFNLLLVAQAALRRAFRPDGFNVGMNLGRAAGAGVPGHLHLHVVPRWTADTNFMTPVSGVRVLPHDLPQVYNRLQKALRPRR